MLLIVGLGNPGAQYQDNRHNIGFMAVDEVWSNHSFSPWTKKFHGLISDGTIEGEKILLLKPQTYMNLSGQSVGEAMRFYKLSPQDIVVIHDELDLIPGKVKVKSGGSSGGHNGIKSIDAHCGNTYRRIRLGIGHPASKELVHNHVLGNFSKSDQDWLLPLLKGISDNLAPLIKGNDSLFMNRIAANKSEEKTRNTSDKQLDNPVKKQSHIRQARPLQHKQLPKDGPMADMLKRLFAKDD